jgi:hypothetical protein
MSLSSPEAWSDRVVMILKEMREFSQMKDIIPLIGTYINNGQRLLFSYRRGTDPKLECFLIALQLPSSLTRSSVVDPPHDYTHHVEQSEVGAAATTTAATDDDSMEGDLVVVALTQPLGEVPSTDWDAVHLIAHTTHPTNASSSSATATLGGWSSTPTTTTIVYGRSRPDSGKPPHLVSWNMMTNEVAKTISYQLLAHYDACLEVINPFIVWFGMSLHLSLTL